MHIFGGGVGGGGFPAIWSLGQSQFCYHKPRFEPGPLLKIIFSYKSILVYLSLFAWTRTRETLQNIFCFMYFSLLIIISLDSNPGCFSKFYYVSSLDNNYLLSLLREVKGGKNSDIQNNANESKQVLVTDITILSLQGTVISVTSTRLDEFVLFYMSEILSSYDFL